MTGIRDKWNETWLRIRFKCIFFFRCARFWPRNRRCGSKLRFHWNHWCLVENWIWNEYAYVIWDTKVLLNIRPRGFSGTNQPATAQRFIKIHNSNAKCCFFFKKAMFKAIKSGKVWRQNDCLMTTVL